MTILRSILNTDYLVGPTRIQFMIIYDNTANAYRARQHTMTRIPLILASIFDASVLPPLRVCKLWLKPLNQRILMFYQHFIPSAANANFSDSYFIWTTKEFVAKPSEHKLVEYGDITIVSPLFSLETGS